MSTADVSASPVVTESVPVRPAQLLRRESMFLDRANELADLVGRVGIAFAELFTTPDDQLEMWQSRRSALRSAVDVVHRWFSEICPVDAEPFLAVGILPVQVSVLGQPWPGSMRRVRELCKTIGEAWYRPESLYRALMQDDPRSAEPRVTALMAHQHALADYVEGVQDGRNSTERPPVTERFVHVESALRDLCNCALDRYLALVSSSCTSHDAYSLADKFDLRTLTKDAVVETYHARAKFMVLAGPALRFVRAIVATQGCADVFRTLGYLQPRLNSLQPFPYYVMGNDYLPRYRIGPVLGSWQSFDIERELGRPRAICNVRLLLWFAACADPAFFGEPDNFGASLAPLLAVRWSNIDGEVELQPATEIVEAVRDGARRVAAAALVELRTMGRIVTAIGRRSGE